MRWPISRKKVNMFKWHLWFAWHPVYLPSHSEWRWLEKVARRLINVGETVIYEDRIFAEQNDDDDM